MARRRRIVSEPKDDDLISCGQGDDYKCGEDKGVRRAGAEESIQYQWTRPDSMGEREQMEEVFWDEFFILQFRLHSTAFIEDGQVHSDI